MPYHPHVPNEPLSSKKQKRLERLNSSAAIDVATSGPKAQQKTVVAQPRERKPKEKTALVRINADKAPFQWEVRIGRKSATAIYSAEHLVAAHKEFAKKMLHLGKPFPQDFFMRTGNITFCHEKAPGFGFVFDGFKLYGVAHDPRREKCIDMLRAFTQNLMVCLGQSAAEIEINSKIELITTNR